MNKLILFFCILTSLSFSIHAEKITYSGYTLDTETNLVTGNGLEWLRWDQTKDYTISLALGVHSEFRLATFEEMSELVNTFSDVPIPFSMPTENDPHTGVRLSRPYENGLDGLDYLTLLMGETYAFPQWQGVDENGNDVYAEGDDAISDTGAVFGNINENGDSVFGTFMTWSDTRLIDRESPGGVIVSTQLLPDGFGFTSDEFMYLNEDVQTSHAESYTVALVRNAAPVPEIDGAMAPLSLALLCSLLVLGAERRKKKTRA